MMLHRAHSISTIGKLGDEFLNQGCFADFLVAHDQQDFGVRVSLVDAVSIGDEAALSARGTESATAELDFAVKINSLATLGALDPVATVARHLLSRNLKGYALDGEQRVVRHDAIGLLLGFPWIGGVLDVERRESSGVILGQNSDRLLRFRVDKGRRHLAVGEEFQGSLTQRTTSDGLNGIGRTAINLHEHHKFFASLRLVDADPTAPGHGQAHAEYLSRAAMTVAGRGFIQQFFQAAHGYFPPAAERLLAWRPSVGSGVGLGVQPGRSFAAASESPLARPRAR